MICRHCGQSLEPGDLFCPSCGKSTADAIRNEIKKPANDFNPVADPPEPAPKPIYNPVPNPDPAPKPTFKPEPTPIPGPVKKPVNKPAPKQKNNVGNASGNANAKIILFVVIALLIGIGVGVGVFFALQGANNKDDGELPPSNSGIVNEQTTEDKTTEGTTVPTVPTTEFDPSTLVQPSASESVDPIVKYANGKSANQTKVELRYGPSAEKYSIVIHVDNNERVTAHSTDVNGWTFVDYAGTEGWVRTLFLFDKSLETTTSTQAPQAPQGIQLPDQPLPGLPGYVDVDGCNLSSLFFFSPSV